MRAWRFFAICAICLCSGARADAEPVADFYTGRTVTIIVGSEAGGGYDALAHLLARHMGHFIPGHPSFIVQNMPGAASAIAANNLFNAAPRDGATIGLIQRTLLTANLTHQKGIRFDIAKFNWIGNLANDVALFMSWHTSPIKTIDDLFRREMVMGGGGPTSDSEVQVRLLNALIGTKIRIVSGYAGQAQIQLAMERGEVEGLGGWSWSNLISRDPSYLSEHKVNILLQGALKRAPQLPDTPTPFDFVRTAEGYEILELFYRQQMVARPILAPPGVPPDRLDALRKAFMDMTADAAFREESNRLKLDINASSFASIEDLIRNISATPAAIAERFAAFNNPPE